MTGTRRLVVCVLAAVPAAAEAQPGVAEVQPAAARSEPSPVAIIVAPQLRVALTAPQIENFEHLDDNDGGGAPAASVGVAIGWRVTRELAVGVRGDWATRHYGQWSAGTIMSDSDSVRALLLDAAATAVWDPAGGRPWFSPRLGRRFTRLSDEHTDCVTRNGMNGLEHMCFTPTTSTAWSASQFVLGLTVGFDVLPVGASRLSIFADTSYGTADHWSAGLGVAWRL